MLDTSSFNEDILKIDPQEEVDYIVDQLRTTVYTKFKKKGAVLGISGGVDSSVVAVLCLRAFGRDKVLTLTMPEYDTAGDTKYLSDLLIEKFKLKSTNENIGGILKELQCYKRRNDAIREVIPEFEDDWKCKIALPKTHLTGQINFFSVFVMSPEGRTMSKRLSLSSYQKIVAASNLKQRVRKMIEYYYCEALNYADIGTPNQVEYDQGFFVKYGDGAADVKPIAHLYKTQVYQLAEYFGIPEEITKRPPTTDTYSLPQTQDEFYFSVPYREMDLCLYGLDNHVPAEIVADSLGVDAKQVERIYQNITQKKRMAKYLHSSPEIFNNFTSSEQ
ncbi:MAG: NAD(+) synthase [Bdellovibrionales bacterium GWA2_49_15]|nr:MAG: NAD(+) synthase [Bdellovibrionales bacterium GWA2_49_15]HAZ13627.1 NAD(+) synthase [Bdellovibrionales bacterium]